MSIPVRLELCLYVAGTSAHSQLAKQNLQTMAALHAATVTYNVQVVDVLVEPLRALQDRILVTPTLVKRSPGPEVRIIGNLSERETVQRALVQQPFTP